MVEYTTDKGIILEDKETKYYYQKYSEEKDFNTEVKGILNTTFSEITVTTLSRTYEVYSRSYKKLPQLLAEIGGIANSLYIIIIFLNFYIEKKVKEAEIFNLCCSYIKEDKSKTNEKSSESLKMNEIHLRSGDLKNSNNIINQDNNNLNGDRSNLELGLNKEKENNDASHREFNKNNERDKDDEAFKSVVRFKSIIFHKDVSLDMLIDVDYSLIEIICPFRRRARKRQNRL